MKQECGPQATRRDEPGRPDARKVVSTEMPWDEYKAKHEGKLPEWALAMLWLEHRKGSMIGGTG